MRHWVDEFRDDKFFVCMRGEGSSGDSIVILSENQSSGESPLLPSPLVLPKTNVILNSSAQRNKYLTEIFQAEE